MPQFSWRRPFERIFIIIYFYRECEWNSVLLAVYLIFSSKIQNLRNVDLNFLPVAGNVNRENQRPIMDRLFPLFNTEQLAQGKISPKSWG